jgi:hypothetical protein
MIEKQIHSEESEEEDTINQIDEQEPDDLYFVSAGFEDRALSATESLDPDYQSKLGLIYVNKEYFNKSEDCKTKKHLKQLEESMEEHCDEVDVIMGSWLEADEQLFSLREGLQVLDQKDNLNITIDVTAFNREALLVSFNILYSICDDVTTRVLYVSPKEHGSWLSKGHQSVRNVIGFAGIQNSSKPTLLAILSGFEDDRAMNTIDEIEPAKVCVGVGDPPTKESFLQKNKQRQELILNRQDTDEFNFPADSIQGSHDAVSQLISEYSDEYNIIMSPMSTKLSTLGMWKAVNDSEEVQVVYTIPSEYNIESYSTGVDSMYVGWI